MMAGRSLALTGRRKIGTRLTMSMTERRTGRVYDIWSKLYDCTFGFVTRNRQDRALSHLHLRAGQRVLDLGVGTGSMLSWYPRDVRVVGMDLSRGMLFLAAERRTQGRLDHCELIQGDAMCPPFAAASFDHIVISHTISVVSDPVRVMQWAARLVRPGGRVVLLNHFLSASPFLAVLGKALNPLCMWMGWRSDVALETLLRSHELKMEYSFQPRMADLWTVVVLHRPEQTPGRGLRSASTPRDHAPRDDASAVPGEATISALISG